MKNYRVTDQQYPERLCMTNRKGTNNFVISAEWWSQLPVSFELMPLLKSSVPSLQLFQAPFEVRMTFVPVALHASSYPSEHSTGLKSADIAWKR